MSIFREFKVEIEYFTKGESKNIETFIYSSSEFQAIQIVFQIFEKYGIDETNLMYCHVEEINGVTNGNVILWIGE